MDYEQTSDHPESSEGPTSDPTPASSTFEELGLQLQLLENLRYLEYLRPTEVQAKAIPPALAGRDLLVQSRTGSGKTAAFGIPLLQSLVDPKLPAMQALILAPTRELAIQVGEECGRLAANTPHKVTAIYGGAAMGPQVTALKEGAQIVAGTPGRVLDHIRRGTLRTDALRVLVLDEGDEMLSMGFHEEITAIIERLPVERQTMLFSATIPEEINRLVDRHLRDPERLYLSADFIGVPEIRHIYYLITGGDRLGALLQVLEFENPTLALIFCNTRDDTATVAEFLRRHDFEAEGISSDLTQADRERVMARMRAGELRYLVATDIAARGIDLSDLSHVVNYTFPESADIYIHRTGRTGRAGKSGVAVSLVSPREIGSFYYLKLIHKIYPEERHLPSAEERAARREGERYERLLARCAGKTASEEMRSFARRIWSTLDGERIFGLALSALLEEQGEILELAPPVARRLAPEAASGARGEPSAAREESAARRRRGDGRERREARARGGEEGEARGRRSRTTERTEARAGGRRPAERSSTKAGGPGGDRRRSAAEAPGEQQESRRARKTTRSVRHRGFESVGEQGSFTTPDGDVEYWETVESESATPEGVPAAREQEEPSSPAADAVRLYLGVGRKHGARAGDLADFVVANGGIERDQIQALQVRETHSYLTVVTALADHLVERLAGKPYNEQPLRIERAKSR